MQTGWTWLTWSSQSQKNKINIKNKIRYDIKTQKVLCANVQMSKWHCQYEVENNECVISDYEVSQMMLTLRGRLYRRRYQLVFFKTSAKDIKNTPSILVVQISVIHQLKLWSVYFFCVHSRIQQNFVVLEKKKKTNRMRSLSSPSPRAALQNTSLKWTVTQRKLNTRTWELYL